MSHYATRNRMTRLVLDKIDNDNYLNQLDHSEWYRINDLQHLAQSSLFFQCDEDEDTKIFIENCFEKSDWFMTQFFHSLMLSVLKWFMATTSINGLLQRGSMFVFSMHQFRTLIDFDTKFGAIKLDNLLDLGSGDGAVTSKMAPFFNNIYCTEMSSTMQWRLGQRGYKVLDTFNWDKYIPEISLNHSNSGQYLKYDAISVLNLLDRCDKPLTLLKQIKSALKPKGLLIIALVLPFKPYVEYNPDNKPTEDLLSKITKCETNATNSDFCLRTDKTQRTSNQSKNSKIITQIDLFIQQVAILGFDLLKFTKLPYLCEGNLSQSYYFMFDYVFVFQETDQSNQDIL